MRLLWLSHVLPHPPKGGVLQRSYHLIRGASSVHDVDLLTFRQRAFHPDLESLSESVDALAEFVDVRGVVDLPVDRGRAAKMAKLLSSAVTAEPYSIRWNAGAEMDRCIRELASENEYDVVHFDAIGMFQYRHHFPKTVWVLNHHNIESQMMYQRAEHAPLPLRTYLRWEARRLARWEARHGAEADLHLVVSKLDAERICQHVTGAQCAIVENSVDTAFFRPLGTEKRAGHVVFVGRIDGYANLSAVRWLRDEIWPLIEGGDQRRTLGIVGRNPPDDIVAWGRSNASVEVSGFVDDVRSAFDEAEVFVCPIYQGGGTRLKILDAMAMGLPIVSHSMAIEGLDIHPEEHVLVADDARSTANAVERLLTDRGLRERLGGAAQARIEALYSTRAVHKHLNEAYEQAFQRGRADTR